VKTGKFGTLVFEKNIEKYIEVTVLYQKLLSVFFIFL
jgi:hypothetical protein